MDVPDRLYVANPSVGEACQANTWDGAATTGKRIRRIRPTSKNAQKPFQHDLLSATSPNPKTPSTGDALTLIPAWIWEL